VPINPDMEILTTTTSSMEVQASEQQDSNQDQTRKISLEEILSNKIITPIMFTQITQLMGAEKIVKIVIQVDINLMDQYLVLLKTMKKSTEVPIMTINSI